MRILTFDIEDYHHLLDISGLSDQYAVEDSIVESEVSRILNILKKNDVQAIFFILGEIAVRFPHVVRAIAADKHIIGTHSFSHSLHKDLSDEEFVQDLEMSITEIEKLSGTKVRCYRAPGFSLTREYFYRFQLLKSHGIDFDFSLFEGSASHGGVEIRSTTEVPLCFETSKGVVQSFPFMKSNFLGLSLPVLGGGYFRLLPESVVLSAARRQEYLMTYFHPRDFSKSQRRLKGLNPYRFFKAYVGLAGAQKKLEKLAAIDRWSSLEYFR